VARVKILTPGFLAFPRIFLGQPPGRSENARLRWFGKPWIRIVNDM
jgi:hypothetical protein